MDRGPNLSSRGPRVPPSTSFDGFRRLEVTMKNRGQIAVVAVWVSAMSAACAHEPSARDAVKKTASAQPANPTEAHDFDFLAGEWDVMNRRLAHRGVGSNEWTEFPATIRGARYLDGVASVDQIDFPTLGFSGLTVRTFDLKTRRWSIYWVNGKRGCCLTNPVEGVFVGDRGEFYGTDEDDGRPVRVRYVWTKLGPDSARWEQAFDYGDGKWELNWMNTLTRRH